MGLLVRAVLAVVAVAVLVGVAAYAASAGAPRTTAGQAELNAQRAGVERAVQRVYAAAIEQLKTTRGLRLAVSDAQAAVIEQKYTDQLIALRQSALQALAEAYAVPADQQAAFVAQTINRLGSASAAPSAEPVMLAPRLYQIVQRMGELAGQLSDAGIKEMTQSTPSASPSATARPSASPSPTR
ncbi:MAG: hypothetical protein M3R54_05330 [Chloroflexota bacterium]|nr:hypothetical protein [Chloroflexota bacterium]